MPDGVRCARATPCLIGASTVLLPDSTVGREGHDGAIGHNVSRAIVNWVGFYQNTFCRLLRFDSQIAGIRGHELQRTLSH